MSDVGELLLFVRGWMARMELKLIRTRTKEGMAAARARGVKIGRPRIEEPRAEEARRLRAQGLTYGQIAERLGTTQMRVRRALGYLYPKERLKHPPPAS
jgi:DNA invertase Pin-like site-specific DNA recombinase